MSRVWKASISIFVAIALLALVAFVVIGSEKSEQALTLRSGSRGDEVVALQKALKEQGFYSGKADGVYGAGTATAVKKMQKAYGLTVDGIAGSSTLSSLGISGGEGKGDSGRNTYSGSEEYLLAKTIYAEARGEPYQGKVAVGAVILNRVKSDLFPNSITEVVYQPWAFTAVHDGQINLEPNEECKRAARDAINGWDPTYGCLYYYNPAKATSQWIFSTKTVTEIGKHVFSI